MRMVCALTGSVLIVALAACTAGSAGRPTQQVSTAPTDIGASDVYPTPETTATAGTVPINAVGSKHVCVAEQHFCVDFPYVEIAFDDDHGYSAKDEVPQAGMDWSPYSVYGTTLYFTAINRQIRFCTELPDSCQPTDFITHGGTFESYTLWVTTDADGMDHCSDAASADRVESSIQLDGFPATKVTCPSVRINGGKEIVVRFIRSGNSYELQTQNTRREPFFADQFFRSFHFM